MKFVLQPWQMYFLILAGWVNRQQQDMKNGSPDSLYRATKLSRTQCRAVKSLSKSYASGLGAGVRADGDVIFVGSRLLSCPCRHSRTSRCCQNDAQSGIPRARRALCQSISASPYTLRNLHSSNALILVIWRNSSTLPAVRRHSSVFRSLLKTGLRVFKAGRNLGSSRSQSNEPMWSPWKTMIPLT